MNDVVCPCCFESDVLEYENHEINDNTEQGGGWAEYDVYYCNACKCTFDVLTDQSRNAP